MFDSTFGTFLRLIISLPIVLALAYFGTKMILSRQFFRIGNQNQTMKVIDRIQLGPKAFLSIVEVDKKFYLFANQENSINLLKELEDFEPPEHYDEGFNEVFSNINFQEILDKNIIKLKDRFKKGDNSNDR